MERFQMRPLPPTQVSAVQLQGPTSVGRQKGRRGDWLVAKAGGLLEIVPAATFAATYEPITDNGHPRGGGGNGKPSVRRRPRAQGRRQKVAGTKPPAPAPAPSETNGRGKLTDAQLATMKRRYEASGAAFEAIDAIAEDFDVSGPTVTNRAKAGDWTRGERPSAEKPARPKPGAVEKPAAAAPKKLAGVSLSSRTKCTSCDLWTGSDPCEHCGSKLRRDW